MPVVLRGIVAWNTDGGGFCLQDEHDSDKLSTLLERYKGKKIDLVISVREHV